MKQFVKKVLEMYKPFRWAILGMFGFIAISQAINLISPYLQGKIVDGLISGKPINGIFLLVGATLIISVLRIVMLSYWQDAYEIEKLHFPIQKHLYDKTLRKVLTFSIGQHIGENSGIKQSVINRGQHSLMTLAYQIMYQVLPTIVEVFLMVGILMWYSAILGFVTLTGIILYAGLAVYVNMRFRENMEKMEKMYNENFKLNNEVMRNIDFVIANAQESKAAKECDENFGKVAIFCQNTWVRFVRFLMANNVILGLTNFSILAIGVFLTHENNYTVGELVMFLYWSNGAVSGVKSVGGLHRHLMQSYTSARKYFDMLSIEPDVIVMSNPVSPKKFDGRIEFRNVTFRYKRRGKPDEEDKKSSAVDMPVNPALDGVNFVIEPGEIVALVGESGAGKSTVVNAIIRAQDPDGGQVIIDGNDLRVIDLKKFRESIGLVSQNVSLFDNTLRHNITYGLNGRSLSVTDEELMHVAEMARIDRFLPRLEQGFDTFIGERGVKLSGGERQRVGIARALIKNPNILILDEATSNLDSENERLIYEAIREASKGRTTIIIAHRFSTIRDAKKVIVFEKGMIAGIGTHKELAETCEPYKRLIQNQKF